jgi:hypothetical protein
LKLGEGSRKLFSLTAWGKETSLKNNAQILPVLYSHKNGHFVLDKFRIMIYTLNGKKRNI